MPLAEFFEVFLTVFTQTVIILPISSSKSRMVDFHSALQYTLLDTV